VSGIDPRRYLLPEADSRRIFTERIAPRELTGISVEHPTVVFVAGQPGAGKTKTTEAVVRSLDDRGGAVVVNSDYYKPYHPEYHRLLAEEDHNAAPYTSLDGRRWMAMAEQYLIGRRINTVIETTMRDPGDFLEPARMFRDAGYRTEVVIMAVPEAQSRLGILARYHDQVAALGHGRLTETSNHDASYHGVLQAAGRIDRDDLIDAVAVYRRGNQLLYANNRTPERQWAQPPGAQAAVETERHHTWTYPEAQDFLDTSRRLATGLGPQWAPQLQEIKNLARPFLPPGAEAHADAAVDNQARPRRARPAPATSQEPGPRERDRDRDDLDPGPER